MTLAEVQMAPDIESRFAAHKEHRKTKTVLQWTAKDFDVCRALTRRGEFRQILTKPQRVFYDAWKSGESKELALYCGRKIGKTWTDLIIAYEFAYRNPDTKILFVLPELKQSKEIIYPMVQEVEKFLPSDVLPRLLRSEGKIVFPNRAEIRLGGAKPENVESLRGPACHLLILDEIAFYHAGNFHNALNNIIKPQLTLTRGTTLYTTTPPRSPDHPFVTDIFPRLQAKECWHHFDIFDNPLLTPESIQEIADECGGYETETFKREYLGLLIADDSVRVIPEFKADKHVVPALPEHTDGFGNPVGEYMGYQVCDTGLVDFTGILTGYLDHNSQKLIITHECMFNSEEPGFCLEYLADRWREQMDKLAWLCPSFDTTIDAFDIVSHELRVKHDLSFSRPWKARVEESISLLRNAFEAGKIVIHADCKQLIYQLENGIWNDQKSDFVRTKLAGHLDLVMCLAYMIRKVDWRRRPGVSSTRFTLGVKPKKTVNKFAHLRSPL